VTVATRRSEITVQAMVVNTIPPGHGVSSLTIGPMREAVNRLTHLTLDPRRNSRVTRVLSACPVALAATRPTWRNRRQSVHPKTKKGQA